MVNLFKSIGVLHYVDDKLFVETDRDLSKYYFGLVPKTVKLHPQRYAPHISVVRNEVPDMECWKKYESEKIEFMYESYVYNGEVYYWLNVFCSRLEEIRVELGLPVSSEYTRPPDGFSKCFHMTLENVKSI